MSIKTDLGKCVTEFFTKYLVDERGVSSHTVRSYSDTFALIYEFMLKDRRKSANNVLLKDINHDVVVSFLHWLETAKKSSVSSRNLRLAAIKSFSKFMQYKDTIHIAQWQSILAVRSKIKEKEAFSYLSTDGMRLLLSQVPVDTEIGRRHLAILSFLYDTGARVGELINVKPSDLYFDNPARVTLFGKGRKKRIVPLHEKLCTILKKYMEEWDIEVGSLSNKPLFVNKNGRKLTNAGIAYIINMYASPARVLRPDLIPDQLSPHSFRHSKAMHLLQSGLNIVYIRDVLGHSSIKTTEIYARADSKQKREALEKAYSDLIPDKTQEGEWENDQELRKWLRGLGR